MLGELKPKGPKVNLTKSKLHHQRTKAPKHDIIETSLYKSRNVQKCSTYGYEHPEILAVTPHSMIFL